MDDVLGNGRAVRLRRAAALGAFVVCGALVSAAPLAANSANVSATTSKTLTNKVAISIPAAGKGEIREITVTGKTKPGASGDLVNVAIGNLASLNPNIRAASLTEPPVTKGSTTTVTIFVAMMNVTGIAHATRAVAISDDETPGDTLDLILAGAGAEWGGGALSVEDFDRDGCSEYLVFKSNTFWISLGPRIWQSPGPEIATNAQAHDSSCKK
jgi:hypothetical protein